MDSSQSINSFFTRFEEEEKKKFVKEDDRKDDGATGQSEILTSKSELVNHVDNSKEGGKIETLGTEEERKGNDKVEKSEVDKTPIDGNKNDVKDNNGAKKKKKKRQEIKEKKERLPVKKRNKIIDSPSKESIDDKAEGDKDENEGIPKPSAPKLAPKNKNGDARKGSTSRKRKPIPKMKQVCTSTKIEKGKKKRKVHDKKDIDNKEFGVDLDSIVRKCIKEKNIRADDYLNKNEEKVSKVLAEDLHGLFESSSFRKTHCDVLLNLVLNRLGSDLKMGLDVLSQSDNNPPKKRSLKEKELTAKRIRSLLTTVKINSYNHYKRDVVGDDDDNDEEEEEDDDDDEESERENNESDDSSDSKEISSDSIEISLHQPEDLFLSGSSNNDN